MDRAERSEPLDDFLCQAKLTGKMMARAELSRGVSDAHAIMATVASICRDISVDWGLPPAAVDAGIRAYLDGARAHLVKHGALRRRENLSIPTEGSTASSPEECMALSPPAAAAVVREGPLAGSASLWLEELHQLCMTTSELTSESRKLMAELREGLEQARTSRVQAQLSLETFHITASESMALLGRMQEMLASTQASVDRSQQILTPSCHQDKCSPAASTS